MALRARIEHFDGQIFVNLRPDQAIYRIADDPDARGWPLDFYFYWDGDKLERGEREFVELEVLDVSVLTDEWLAAIEGLELPRIDVPEAGLSNVTVADALRWARKTFPSRYTGAPAQ